MHSQGKLTATRGLLQNKGFAFCYTWELNVGGLLKAGFSISEIAADTGRHKSTIVKRNTGGNGYRPKQAQRLALARRENKSSPRISREDWSLVEDLVRLDWSPEQISGRLRPHCKTSRPANRANRRGELLRVTIVHSKNEGSRATMRAFRF